MKAADRDYVISLVGGIPTFGRHGDDRDDIVPLRRRLLRPVSSSSSPLRSSVLRPPARSPSRRRTQRDEWLQAGYAANGSKSDLYYEVAKPYSAARYHNVGVAAQPGEAHRVAVIEMQRRPGWWRIWVDRVPVTVPIFLPDSHHRWPPIVTSESWNGGVPSCNAFAYRFSNIRVRHDSWTLLADAYPIRSPGYAVVWRPGAMIAQGGGVFRAHLEQSFDVILRQFLEAIVLRRAEQVRGG